MLIRVRVPSATWLFVIATLGLSACSGDTSARKPDPTKPAASATATPPASPELAVQQAAKRTLATSAAISLTNTLSPEGSDPIILNMRGAHDFRTHIGHLSVTLPGAAGGNREIRETFTPDTIYVRSVSEVDLGIPKDKWAALPRKLAKAQYILRTPANNPETLLEQVGELVEVSKIGAAKINGADAVRYRGKMTQASFEKHAGGDLLAKAEQIFAAGDIVWDVWIDDKGLVVRTINSWPGTVDDGAAATLQFNLSKFGTKESPSPPPKAETVSITALGGALIG